MAEAIGKVMEDMSSSTKLKPMFKPKIPQSLFLFVTSIARTNLEVELIQRGGSLVIPTNEPPYPLLPKRDCIVPLLHVLAAHARVARVLGKWPTWITFKQLCGLLSTKVPITTIAPIEREVPLLLRDPIALLLQYILLLPLHLDQSKKNIHRKNVRVCLLIFFSLAYFTTTVQMVYNLLYYQVVTQVSCGLTNAERTRITSESPSSSQEIRNFCDALALINDCLGPTELYMEDVGGEEEGSRSQVNIVALEQQVTRFRN